MYSLNSLNIKTLTELKSIAKTLKIKGYSTFKKANPNAYLATFAEFMILNKESDYIQNLIKKGLRIFVKNMILQYKEEIKTVPVHFAGSIAYFTQEEIKEVAQEFGFTVGNFERRPIDGLLHYHAMIAKNV